MIHQSLQSVSNIAIFRIIERTWHLVGKKKWEWEGIMSLLNCSMKVEKIKSNIIVSVGIRIASIVLAIALTPKNMLYPWKSDNQILIVNISFSVNVNTSLNNFSSQVEWLVNFHVNINVLVLHNWRSHLYAIN